MRDENGRMSEGVVAKNNSLLRGSVLQVCSEYPTSFLRLDAFGTITEMEAKPTFCKRGM
jgi:hypothetical protein